VSWLDHLRSLRGNAASLARAVERNTRTPSARTRKLRPYFSADVRPDSLILGRHRSSGRYCQLPVDEFCGRHGAVKGGTGTGKTRELEALFVQLLPRLRELNLHLAFLDGKSELAEDVLGTLVPYHLVRSGDQWLLHHLEVVRAFGPRTPALNVTRAEPGIGAEAQANAIATSLEEALDEKFGARMRILLPQLTLIAVTLGLPLTQLLDWLTDPRELLRDALQSRETWLREFARTVYPRESELSRLALAARLRGVLFTPEVRRAFSAPTCVSFHERFQSPGLTFVDVGTPPAGNERLTRLVGSLLFGQLARAALARKIEPTTPRLLIVLEEAPEYLGENEARLLSRVLSLARFRRTAVITSSQEGSQIRSVSRGLDQSLRANAGYALHFRQSPEDAAASVRLMPDSLRVDVASRRKLLNRLVSLPKRRFVFSLRGEGLAVELESPRLDLERLHRIGLKLPEELRDRLLNGDGIAAAEEYPAPRTQGPSVFSDEPDDDAGDVSMGLG
jgi:hypothetical protein